MKKYFIALFFCFVAGPAWAQCNGVWSANSLCGTGGSTGVPHQLGPPLPLASGGTGGTSFTANLPVIGNGGGALTQGTRSGNTTVFATTTGTLTNSHCVSIDGNGNLVDAGGACTVGGGGGTVSSGTANQVTYYTATGTVVGGAGLLVWDNTNHDLTVGATANVSLGGTLHSVQIINDPTVIGSYSSIAIGANSGGTGYAYAKTRGATGSTQTIVANNDNIGGFHVFASDGAAYQEAGYFRSYVDGSPAAGSMPMRWVAATTPSGTTTAVERWRTDNTGQFILNQAGATDIGAGAFLTTKSVDGSNQPQSLQSYQFSNDTTEAVVVFRKSRATTIDTNTIVQSGDFIGSIFFGAANGTNYQAGSIIRSIAADTPVAGQRVAQSLSFWTANTNSSLTERMRIDNVGNIWGNNFNGYTDLRLWNTLACNDGTPTSSGVAQAAVNAYNAGFRSFFIPKGCFIYAGDTPWVSAFGSNTIPTGTRWLGENWETSGISVCASYTVCTPAGGTTLGGSGLVRFTNLFTMDGACYNVDSGSFGHPSRCPIGEYYNNAGSFTQSATYPGSPFIINIGAKTNGTWNGTDQPGLAINQETDGDVLFSNNVATNTSDNFINFFNTHGAVIVAKLDGKSSFGTTSTIHAGNGMLHLVDATGTCDIFTAGSGGIGSTCTSDARLKRDIVDTGDELKWLNTFRIRDYTLRTDGNRYTGTVAQELMATHPDMVVEGDGGMLQVFAPNQWKMIRAMQQMQGEIEELQRKVN